MEGPSQFSKNGVLPVEHKYLHMLIYIYNVYRLRHLPVTDSSCGGGASAVGLAVLLRAVSPL